MKAFFLALFVMVGFAPFASAQDAPAPATATEQEISTVGFNIFKTVCFMMFAEDMKEKRIAFLDEKFVRHDGDKRELFLKMAGGKPGEVWGAVFPQAAFAIVVQDNGNCHVIAQKGDAATIHQSFAQLAQDAGKNMPNITVNIVPKTATDKLESSGFELKGPSGINLLVAIGSTPLKKQEDKPAALMSVMTSAQ